MEWPYAIISYCSGSYYSPTLYVAALCDSNATPDVFPVLRAAVGALACSLTCAGLALADAGVECYDILTGASAVSNKRRRPSTNRKQ